MSTPKGSGMRILTPGGWAAAAAVGALILGFGGWRHAALLVTFFGTSTLLTLWHIERKSHPEHTRGRSASQVLANGLVAAILTIWWGVAPSPSLATAFAAVIAASTADTWATEVGMLSARPPRLITTWRAIPRGASGGVTLLGTTAGLVGAGLIAVCGGVLLHATLRAVWVAGVTAMLMDSVLGATVENRMRWMTNDVVNVLMTAAGAAVGVVLA